MERRALLRESTPRVFPLSAVRGRRFSRNLVCNNHLEDQTLIHVGRQMLLILSPKHQNSTSLQKKSGYYINDIDLRTKVSRNRESYLKRTVAMRHSLLLLVLGLFSQVLGQGSRS